MWTYCEVASQTRAGTSIIMKMRDLSTEQDINHMSSGLTLCTYHFE